MLRGIGPLCLCLVLLALQPEFRLHAGPEEGAACEAALRPLRAPLVLPMDGPTALAVDSTDGSLWITSAISNEVLHLSANLEILGEFTAPFDPDEPAGISGISDNPVSNTLFLVHTHLRELIEVQKDGAEVSRMTLELPAPVNRIPLPTPKGIAFSPDGDAGAGSIWIVEAVMTRVYELSLDGQILRQFCHPDDRDGCPGQGRAANASDLDLVRVDGELVGIELIGGDTQRDQIRHVNLDGELTGLSYPLHEIGGRPGGFARTRKPHPDTGELRDVFYVTTESSAELHVLEITDPSVRPIVGLVCGPEEPPPDGFERDPAAVLLWRNTDDYDSITIVREDEPIAELEGTVEGVVDEDAPAGFVSYEVRARKGNCELSESCAMLMGAGRILRAAPFDGAAAMDMAQDSDGLLWITDDENQLHVYRPDLESQATVPGPFQEEDDVTSAIAFNPADDTLFVYNTTTHEVATIDRGAAPVGVPFPSGITPEEDPETQEPGKVVIASMLFNPDGNGGGGSFWYLNTTAGQLEERGRDGDLLHICAHPDWLREPPPVGTDLRAFAWGLSALPGRGFTELELGGGTIRERRTTRFLRLQTETCEPTGFELPVTDVSSVANVANFAYHRSTREGHPVAYLVSQSGGIRWLFEVDASEPPLGPPNNLRCRQETVARDVTLEFAPHGDPDAVEVWRDSELVATLDGATTRFVDEGVAEGEHRYQVRQRKDGLRSDDRVCEVRVGQGSVARRSFSAPPSSLHALAYDPTSEIYWTVSNLNRHAGTLHQYDREARYLGGIPSPFLLQQVAALAVRVNPTGTSEIYCLGWTPGVAPASQREFPLTVVDPQGRRLRSFQLAPPPPREGAVSFPVAMAWDAATDTLWYVLRNARTIVQFSPRGDILASFPHPSPPHQDTVFNFGMAIAAQRGALYLSGAGRFDSEVTKIIEMTRSGALTGVEIPVGPPEYARVGGFALGPDGFEILVAAGVGPGDLVHIRAFDPLAAVRGLACTPGEQTVELTWTNAESYDAVAIIPSGRDEILLAGDATSWIDPSPDPTGELYRVVARKGALSSAGALCEATLPRLFTRGDVEENDEVNIADAVAILGFLFLGSAPPLCLDAADIDDDGGIELADALGLLNFLFLAGSKPAAPFPDPGVDTTPDALECLHELARG